MKKVSLATAKRLIYYNPNTGEFWRFYKESRRIPAHYTRCMHRDPKGYLLVPIEGVDFLAHRIAWLLMTGNLPKRHMDHVNGNTSDNRFNNLREVNPALNARNRKLRSDCKTGYKGIWKLPGYNRWCARLMINGKRTNFGWFDSPKLAAMEYDRLASIHYGEYARTNVKLGLI